MTQDEMDARVKGVEQQTLEYVKGNKVGVPDMPFCDTVLFIGMKYLYIAFTNSMATKEEISFEKKKLIASYKLALMDDELVKSQARLRNRIASQVNELEKCGCEYCKRMARLFDGRDK